MQHSTVGSRSAGLDTWSTHNGSGAPIRSDKKKEGKTQRADPLACPPAVYRLVTGAAAGNKEALEVYRATEPATYQRPRSTDLERARTAVPERLQALRDARGEPTGDRHPRRR